MKHTCCFYHPRWCKMLLENHCWPHPSFPYFFFNSYNIENSVASLKPMFHRPGFETQVSAPMSQQISPLIVFFFPYLSIIGKMGRTASWYISYGILNSINYTIFIIGYSKETTSLKVRSEKTLLMNTEPELERNWSGRVQVNIHWDSRKIAMTLRST